MVGIAQAYRGVGTAVIRLDDTIRIDMVASHALVHVHSIHCDGGAVIAPGRVIAKGLNQSRAL
jgi:hypothetical protein